MALPQTNARITRVERTEGTATGGYSEDYDRPATDPESAGGEGADKWNGSADAYYIERRQRFVSDVRRLVKSRTLVVAMDTTPIDFEEGDVLTWRFRRPGSNDETQDTGRVLVVEARRMPGQPGVVRLSMEDAAD